MIHRATAALFVASSLPIFAQLGPAPAKPKPPANAKAGAPVDLTGYWTAVVTEDWRWRMVTPIKGDFAGIPLTAAGRRAGDAWDPAADEAAGNQCKAYGAPALLRIPGHLHITWEDENTLKIEADQGQQTRLLHFRPAAADANRAANPNVNSAPAGTAASWQGYSIANWEGPQRGPLSMQQGLGATRIGAQGRSLEVVTTNLKAGYLRKNGAPYSANAVLREYFDLSKEPNGTTWFVVTTIVEDPANLTEPFVTSSNFKQEPDGSKFKPVACSAR